MAIRALCGAIHLFKNHLRNLHSRTKQNRQVCDVGQLQHDDTRESRVYKTCSGVNLQTHAAKTALAVDDANKIIGKAKPFGRMTQGKLARVQNKRLTYGNFDDFINSCGNTDGSEISL